MTTLLKHAFLLASVLLIATGSASGHPGHGPADANGPPAAEPEPAFVYDPADETVAATVLDNPLWYDADVVSTGERLWYAWLEFTPGKGDRIWVGSRADGSWRSREAIKSAHGSYAHPTLTIAAGGRLWLSYEAESAGQWDLFAVPLQDGTAAGTPRRVSPGGGADIRHRAAADAAGGLWFVWQSDHNGQFDVLVRHLTAGGMDPPRAASDQPGGDWHPAVAVSPTGAVYVVWDAYDGDSFNVHLRTLRGGKWDPAIDLAHSGAFEGRPQVAIDKRSRVWIVWEEGGRNWGKPFRGINTLACSDQLGPLHRFRHLQIAVLAADGTVRPVQPPLPQPSWELAQQRPAVDPGSRHLGAFYERARLAIDAAGRPWVAYRHYYTPWLGVEHRSHVEAGWGVYARAFGAGGWSKLYRLDVGQGDGMQALEITPHAGGLCAVWTTGRTHRTQNDRPRGIATALVTSAGSAAADVPVAAAARPDPVLPASDSGRDDRAERVGGRDYRLYYGDLHRHTDLSLCRVPLDGSIDDAYRYAIDVARLDFLGITDHSRDLARGDAGSQLWWRCRKQVGRHQLGTTFFPFFAYERSHSNTADHNVISLRGDMLRPHTYPVPQFWQELDRDTITIPHQPIRRDTWKYQDDDLRPLVEIYQGCRNHAIDQDAHAGLDKGYHLGFIASSDHMSTSASYACVWAEQSSRESIFRALQARRTYGATARIRLAVRAGDHWMGAQFSAAKMPPLEIDARGTAPIRTVHIVVDGKLHSTLAATDRQVSLQPQLDLPGSHYVYVHLVQNDGNQAWSSPLWVHIGAADQER